MWKKTLLWNAGSSRSVEEPTAEETEQILEGLKGRYEEHHKVIISKEAITAAVELSQRYITDRFLPDKAIDLMDEAAASLRLAAVKAPGNILEMEHEGENSLRMSLSRP